MRGHPLERDIAFARHQRQQQVHRQQGQQYVERGHRGEASRHHAFRLQVARHHHHHRRRGADRQHTGQHRHRARHAQPFQRAPHQQEAQRGTGKDGCQQPFFAAQPAQIEVTAELVDHQRGGDIGEHARQLQDVAGQPVKATGAEQEADQQITGDAWHPAHLGDQMAADQTEQQQAAED